MKGTLVRNRYVGFERHSIKSFEWLALVKWPLKWHEIQIDVSIKDNNLLPNWKTRCSVSVKLLCGLFVERLDGGTIHLVHLDARE